MGGWAEAVRRLLGVCVVRQTAKGGRRGGLVYSRGEEKGRGRPWRVHVPTVGKVAVLDECFACAL